MPVSRLVEELSAAEIYEQMAYDLTRNEDFSKKVEKELELEKQQNMSPEEHSKMVLSMFKKKGK